MEKTITVTATGDSLFTADFPKEYLDGKFNEIASVIKSCDVKLTNLETNLSNYDTFANEYSGGTWINVRPKYFKYLKDFGFDFYGTANNHCMDFAFDGILSTLKVLDKNRVYHAGTGRSLDEAKKPAIFTANGAKIAVFAVDCLYRDLGKAGWETKWLKARPGVNYLRHTTKIKIDDADLESLKNIAKKTHVNAERELSIATGYAVPDPEGVFVFDKITFTTDKNSPTTSCNKKDLDRIIADVKKAKTEVDYVFFLVHCHDDDGVSHRVPAEYMVEFSHALIDNGVSAVFGGGCHELRGIEMYKELPIFYSLGDFIYQGMRVEILPADFMEAYSIDKNSTADEALYTRSRGGKVGLQTEVKNFQTYLPKLTFTGEKLTDFKLIPIKLGFKVSHLMEGLPYVAKGEEAKEIFDVIAPLSKKYGTKLKIENDIITLD